MNLGSICYNGKHTYELPIESVLPPHTCDLIRTNRLSELGPVYHNLDAETELQRQAILNQHILLSPWELTLFLLFKSLSRPS